MYHRLHKSTGFIYVCQKNETSLGWLTSEFEIYAAFTPLVTKYNVLVAAKKLIEFITSNKKKFFITKLPTLAFS